VFALGSTSVVVSATDGAGNSSSGLFTVTVRDATAPVLVVPGDVTVEATSAVGAVVSFVASATDAVGPVTITYSQLPGTVFVLGTTTVTVTATDGAGNSSSGSFTVMVRDTTAPVLSVPADVTVEATSAAGATATFAATATDAVGPVTITYSRQSGSVFPLGTTTVTVTATDGAGNSSSGSFTVTVRDTTAPVLSVPADVTVEATSAAGATATFAATATDAVGPVTITYSRQSGSVFPLGTTTVTVTARDAAGNSSTKSFKVIVVDTTPPKGTIKIDGCAPTTTTGNVVVTLSFTDAVGPVRMRFSLDGGATWTAWEPYARTRALTLTGANGTKTVIAQVADAAGNIGSASDSIVLSIPPPTIVVTGISSGQSCDLCSSLFVKITVTTPPAAGAVVVSATLDGKPFALPGTIDPFLLAAGAHTLRVVARDAFGRESVKLVSFSVHATIEGLICAVQRAVKEGLIAPELETSMLANLYAARASRDRGSVISELNQLEAFKAELDSQRGKKVVPSFVDRATGWTDDLISRIKSGAAR
jgi:hypothetical protein